MTQHRIDLDCLKGLAIIAVVLYHIGSLDSGYLGVDVFFAINGFFIFPKLWNDIKNSTFRYFPFIFRKYVRFTPLILLIIALSLILGLFFLLPNQIKVLSESSVASFFFSQNIFATVASGNYWDIQASYSPLMHFWYIGVVFQFYLIIPLLLIGLYQFSERVGFNKDKVYVIFLLVIGLISLSLNFTVGNETQKFYGLPFRLYEFCFGGLMASNVNGKSFGICKPKVSSIVSYSALVVLLLLFCSCFLFYKDIDSIAASALEGGFDLLGKSNLIPREILSLCTVACTSVLIISGCKFSFLEKLLALLGAMSFSIYVWHQFLLAYIRCIYTNVFGIGLTLLFFAVVFCLSFSSFILIEKRIKYSVKTILSCLALSGVIVIGSLYIYSKNGVLRNYPEMDITVENAHSGMYSEYCDRVKQFNTDFPENGKRNLLIVGNSFARDFANVILESPYRDSINISYCPNLSELKQNRLDDADIICYHGFKQDLLSHNIAPRVQLYGIGTKNYGESISVINSKRFREDYYNTTVPVVHTILAREKGLRDSWGENYISFLEPVMTDDGKVKVFTDDHKFISFDCRHLAEAGARYYSELIDLKRILL